MTYPHGGPGEIYRDLKVSGDAAQGLHEPDKAQIRDLWNKLVSKVKYIGSKLVLGGGTQTNPPGEVNFLTNISAVASEGVTYAGTFHKHAVTLDGNDAYQLLAGTYLAPLSVANAEGATWQDAATLYIGGQPQDPADQTGSTSFSLFINSGFNRIRDRLVVGRYDHSNDTLTVNGGSASDFTLTVRNEGVAQPHMFRILEPTRTDGSPCDPNFPMLSVLNPDGSETWFGVRTGGNIIATHFGAGAQQDQFTGKSTTYFLGVDGNGSFTETSLSALRASKKAATANSGATIDTSVPDGHVFLNGTGSPSYTLGNGADGQRLTLLGSQSSQSAIHTVNGSFFLDPDQFASTSTPSSVSLKNGESITVIFRQETLRWTVVQRTRRP